jgi:hypothetical protein
MSEFWGRAIKANSGVQSVNLESSVAISRAALPQGSKKDPTTLYLQVDEQEKVALTTLAWERNEHTDLEVFLKEGSVAKFSVEGPNDVHISGYVVSEEDDDDDDDEGDENDMHINELIRHQVAQANAEKKSGNKTDGQEQKNKKNKATPQDSPHPKKQKKNETASAGGATEKKEEKKEDKKGGDSIPCPHCPKKLKHAQGLEQHIKAVHSSGTTTPTKDAASSEKKETPKKGAAEKNKPDSGKKKGK